MEYNGRWQHSELLDKFPGKIFDGTSPSIKCAQPVGPFNGGDELIENCLTLDIYRPIGSDKGEILFWIHGGAFMYGDAASYQGIEQASVYGNTVKVTTKLCFRLQESEYMVKGFVVIQN